MNRREQVLNLKSVADITALINSLDQKDRDLSFLAFKCFLLDKDVFFDPYSFAEDYYLVDENDCYNLLADLMSDQNPFSLNFHYYKLEDDSKPSAVYEFGLCSLIKSYHLVMTYTQAYNLKIEDVRTLPRKVNYRFSLSVLEALFFLSLLNNDYRKGTVMLSFHGEYLLFSFHPQALKTYSLLDLAQNPYNTLLSRLLKKIKLLNEEDFLYIIEHLQADQVTLDMQDERLLLKLHFDPLVCAYLKAHPEAKDRVLIEE